MKTNIFFLSLIFILTSCIKEVDFNVTSVPRKLVVNSVITAYSPIIVNISGLQSILDTSLLFIDNATVIVAEEGGNIDTLSYLSKGNYESYIYCEPGKVYRLTVKAEGYPTVFACDTIPARIKIKNASKRESVTVDEYGEPHNDFTVTFSRDMEKTNYYDLFFIYQQKNKNLMYSINYESLAVSIDPIILSSGTTDYNFITYLFNDANISDEEYTIAMKMMRGVAAGGEFNKPIIAIENNVHAVVLRTVSKTYYNYRNAWGKHQYYKNDSKKIEYFIYIPLVGEPQEMFSNIENGLGIFAAYNQDYFIL